MCTLEPPTFITHPKDKKVYLSDPKTSFTCKAEKVNSYQWKREDGGMPINASGICTNTLKFENLLPEHAGKYHCVAKNDSGTSVSNSSTLTIIGEPIIMFM